METLRDLYLGTSFLYQNSKAVSLKMMTLNNETFFKIEHVNQMTPFL